MIRRNSGLRTVAIISLISTVILLSGFTFLRKGRENYVVLVSMDAFRWDYPALYDTPNLDRLEADGVRAPRMISSFPTNTFPNHYSIATGLRPDHHGIINNSFYAPDLGLSYRIGDRTAVENGAFYQGEPVWVTARKQGLITASFYWVGSEAPAGGMQPHYWKKYDENVTYEERIDTVVKWLGYPAGRRPHLVTLYFDEPDATSHDFGPVSPETGEVVSYLDSLIGDLRMKLSKLHVAKRITLIVLSDHGMAEVSSERYVNISDAIPRRMVTSLWGGNPVYLLEPATGKKDSILRLLGNVEGIKAWEKNKLPERWNYGTHPRIPEIVVVADSSWYLSNRPRIATFRGGAHGYDNMNPDMHAIFYAAGPAINRNAKIDQLYNTDIYNLVCRILKIKPAPNDGIVSNIERVLR
jgi:alkaline phosphatase D